MKLISAIAGFFGVSLAALAWIGIALALIGTGAAVHAFDQARHEAAIAKRDAIASGKVAAANARTLKTEREAQARATEMEIAAHDRQAELDKTLAENRRLAAAAGGLHDPGRKPAAGARMPAAPAAACASADPAAEGRLSAEATRFLLEFGADADRAAGYAITGHAYAETVKPGGR